MDNLYNLTTQMEDYVKLKMDGVLSWISFSLCASDSEYGLDNWR
jgi:hypothetical protein